MPTLRFSMADARLSVLQNGKCVQVSILGAAEWWSNGEMM